MHSKKRKPGFYIEVGCPGCGGELEVEENFFVTTCSHCGSVLRLVMPDCPTAYLAPKTLAKREIRFNLDRYLKKRSLPLTDADLQIKAVYYPFWKIDSLLLKVRNRVHRRVILAETEYQSEVTTETEKTDIAVVPYSLTLRAGPALDGVPDSLGVRGDVVKLVPFSEEHVASGFDSLPVVRSWDKVRSNLGRSLATVDEIEQAAFGDNLTEMFNPVFSLVFFPFYIVESYREGYRRFVVDGASARILQLQAAEGSVAGSDGDHVDSADELLTPSMVFENAASVMSVEMTEEPEEEAGGPRVEFGRLDIEFHRCTTCGVDLPDEKSYLYVCKNCQEIKTVERTPLPVNQIYRIAARGKNPDSMFPFWALKMPNPVAAKLQRMLGGIHRSERIVVPAFRTRNFEALYRLARRISAAYPQLELTPVEAFDRNFTPVSVSMSEAFALAEIVIYRRQVAMVAEGISGMPARESVIPVQADLFYAPFHPESYFFVDSVLGNITFEKNVLA
ncbi:MAG: hypothetical protein OEW00_00420 [candidate division Zixibacteria bacterium]|nr:hypothetical protein [candidate division Zixibacteria bacterium]